MARSSSRLGADVLLRNCRCWNFSEGFLAGTGSPPVLGGAVGSSVGKQGFGVGSIRRASFGASCVGGHGLIGFENCHGIGLLRGVKFVVCASGGLPPRTRCGSLGLGFNRTFTSESASPAPRGPPPIMRSGKVIARISNIPKFVFKSDLLWLLKGCNLTPEDFLYIYDSKCRLKFIEMQLPSLESFQLAQRSLASKGRFGGRYLKLTSEEFEMDGLNKILGPFRGRSLLMTKVPFGCMTEDVERFFSGYALDCNYPIKFLRSPVQVQGGANRGSMTQVKLEFEMRAVVRFRTEIEALRALRERQGAICVDKPTDLRFIS